MHQQNLKEKKNTAPNSAKTNAQYPTLSSLCFEAEATHLVSEVFTSVF